MNNEPRNINGKVFTTDKCIKYNIRRYIHQNYEDTESQEDFVFFFPRKTEDADEHKASFMTKTEVFEDYFNSDFDKLLDSCPDARIFGGTFTFKEGMDKYIYGPVQMSYGLDIIGADIINLRIGTPFASESGQQKTTGEERVVDHSVISYDINVNPKNSPELLTERDIELFKEGIIKGTNLRKSTSKKTDSKALILLQFKDGKSINIGQLKNLVKVQSDKVTDPEEKGGELVLDLSDVKEKVDDFVEDIEEIEIFTDNSTEILNFYGEETDADLQVKEAGFHEL